MRSADDAPTVCIVTPTFNSAAFLEPTLLSILSQSGDFNIRYHVQDGGSSDQTLAILARWAEMISSGSLPKYCKTIDFTYATDTDRGLYDAVNKAFVALNPAASDIIAWLNSDDLLVPGALATVVSFFDAVPSADLVGGRMCHIDTEGRIIFIGEPQPYSRECMRAGLYDGRAQDFIQQEGTFWRARLWYEVAGLDPSLKLAGDWDLWRRFAQVADFYALDTITAFHRRRRGQLSENLEIYYQEVDAKLAASGRAEYDRLHDGVYQRAGEFFIARGHVAKLDEATTQWSVKTCPDPEPLTGKSAPKKRWPFSFW